MGDGLVIAKIFIATHAGISDAKGLSFVSIPI
jgi:hypothetical protein